MDSLSSLIKDHAPQTPPDIAAIKQYLKEKYNIEAVVATSDTAYTIEVPSASYATVVRMDLPNLLDACSIQKKIYIRIRSVTL